MLDGFVSSHPCKYPFYFAKQADHAQTWKENGPNLETKLGEFFFDRNLMVWCDLDPTLQNYFVVS